MLYVCYYKYVLFLFYLIKKLIMETELEKNERLYRCELERLIRYQEENVIHRADLFLIFVCGN